MEAQQIKTLVERALISYSGTTTGDGGVGGDTLVCSGLTTQPDYNRLSVLISEGAYAGLTADIVGTTTGGTINVEPSFPGQIVSGINFHIIPRLPAYSELIDIMGTGFDTATNSLVKLHDDHVTEITAARMAELDAANIPADIDTLLAAIALDQSLAYHGVIASIPAANQFIVTAFIGLGAGKFAGATLPWQVYVLRDSAGAGAAPQGELQPVTAFDSTTGQVNHSAFTVALVATDEILLLHPSVAHIDFSATEKASINVEVDNALNTAVPGAPTADSINERIKTLDDAYTAARAVFLDELAAANIPADIDTLLTRITAAVALASSLTTHETAQATHRGALTTHETAQATHRTALGTHDTDIKALLAAVALEATLGTHDTDIKALLATIAGYIDTEVASILAAVDTEVAAILEDTGTTLPATLATIAGYIDTEVATIIADIAALNDLSAANVNTEVDNALDTAIPGVPTANSINERIKTLDEAYTAARAVYLDNLSAGAAALEATLGTHDTALGTHDTDIKALLTTIAGYIDTEVASILAAVDTEVADILTDTNELQGLIAASKIAAQVKGIDNIDLSATMKTSVNTEVDNALDTAIPGSPTAGSINERIKTLDEAYTAAKAAYLDAAISTRATPTQVNTEVDNALDTAIPGAPTANSINERIKTLDEAYTATRAGYLDELAAANIPADVDTIKALVDSVEAAGPYSYLDAGGEQTVVEDTAVTRRRVWFDFSNRNMTQTGTFRIYRKVDGTNYDIWDTVPCTVAAGDDRAWDAEFTTNQAWKLTYEEGADEGANRDIPYNVITQVIE